MFGAWELAWVKRGIKAGAVGRRLCKIRRIRKSPGFSLPTAKSDSRPYRSKTELYAQQRAVGVHVVFEVRLVVVVTELAVADDECCPAADLRAYSREGLPSEFGVRTESADIAADRYEKPVVEIGAGAQTDDRINPRAGPVT